MAKRLEDEQERPEAMCPCCGEPLVVEVNVVGLPDGRLALGEFKLRHRDAGGARPGAGD